MPKKPKSDSQEPGGPLEASGHSASGGAASVPDPVLDAIASLRSDLAHFKAEICSTIESKVSDATTVLREKLASLKAENDSAIASLKNKMETNASAIAELTDAANHSSDTVRDLESTVETLRKQVTTLTEKCLDLEGRSKRNNLRVSGVREGKENGRGAREFAAQLLKDTLDLEEIPLIDRAHRALRRKPGDGEPPRQLIIRLHYCHTLEDIMRKVMGTRELSYQGDKIRIFRDLPAEVAKRRAMFTPVRKMLHDKPGVRYGLLYPAKLRISHDDTERFFTDPEEARRYVARQLEKVE